MKFVLPIILKAENRHFLAICNFVISSSIPNWSYEFILSTVTRKAQICLTVQQIFGILEGIMSFYERGGGVGEERSVIRILQSHRGRSAECYRKTKKIFLPPLPQKGKVMPSTLYST